MKSPRLINESIARICNKTCDNCGGFSCGCKDVEIGSGTPDYYHDLNAIQCEVNKLDAVRKKFYLDFLIEIIGYNEISPKKWFNNLTKVEQFFLIGSAAPTARCEAFLKTKGEWNETLNG